MAATNEKTNLAIQFVAAAFSVAGYPGVGAAISLAGNLLFPVTPDQPALSDLNITQSQAGIRITKAYGVPKPIAGVIMWKRAPLDKNFEISNPIIGPHINALTRTQSFAVGLCEGPMFAIRRIWANNKLVYDVSETASEEALAASVGFANETGMAFYQGTADQMPDPHMEAVEGVGNVTAHRGHCYVRFMDFPLREYNEQIPNLTFEVVQNGSLPAEVTTQYATDVLYPWDAVNNPPRNCLNDHVYTGGSGLPHATVDEAIADYIAWYSIDPTLFEEYHGWAPIDEANRRHVVLSQDFWSDPLYNTDPGEIVDIAMFYNRKASVQKAIGRIDTSDPSVIDATIGLGGGGRPVYWSGDSDYSSLIQPGIRYAAGSQPTGAHSEGDHYCMDDVAIHVTRKIRSPDNPCHPLCGTQPPALPENPTDWCVIGSSLVRDAGWTPVSGTFKVLSIYATVGVLPGPIPFVSDYPLGPVLIPADPNYSSSIYWTAQNAAAEAAGTVPSGRVYGVDYPVIIATAYSRSWTGHRVVPDVLIVADIVGPELITAGMAPGEYNVSQLTEILYGYLVTQVAAPKDTIAPLLTYSLASGIDEGDILNFIPHNQPSTFSFTLKDIGATDHDSGESPSAFLTERLQEEELPKTVNVQYSQPGLNTPGQQYYTRQASTSKRVEVIQIPVTAHKDKMAQLAESLCLEAATARQDANFSVSAEKINSAKVCAVGSVLVRDIPINIRLTGRTYNPPGLVDVNGVRFNPDDYTSDAVGAVQPITNGDLGLEGPTVLTIIDGPALSDSSNDAGVFAAIRGVFSGWKGASIWISIDGGATYSTQVSTTSQAASTGTVVGAIGSGPSDVWDYSTTIVVTMKNGATLQSATQDEVLNGANMAFCGADGRWEVLQFCNTTLISDSTYQLDTLLRGRKGTEWAVGLGENGDDFIVIDDSLIRMPLSDSLIGVALELKPVSRTASIDDTTAQLFTPNAVALKPYSPDYLRAYRDTSNGDIVFQANRRTRIDGTWVVPLNEQTEAYELDIYKDGEVIRTLSGSISTIRYLGTDQLADFGAIVTQPSIAWYQLSAVVGRGYPAFATLDVNSFYVPGGGSGDVPPMNPTDSLTIDFSGTVSASDSFQITLVHSLFATHEDIVTAYTLSGAGKASMSDFADDLASQLSGISGIVVSRHTSTQLIVEATDGSVWASARGNTVKGFDCTIDLPNGFSGSAILLQWPLPVSVGTYQQVAIDLYQMVNGAFTLSPTYDGRYSVDTFASLQLTITGLTYQDAETTFGAGITEKVVTVQYRTPDAPGQTLYLGAIGNNAVAACQASAELADFGIVADLSGNGGRVSLGLSLSSNFRIEPISPTLGANLHPSGYSFGVIETVSGVPELPSGAAQVVKVTWEAINAANIHPAVVGQKFSVTLGGTTFTHTIVLADISELYFDAAFNALKALIEATGDYTVTLLTNTTSHTAPDPFIYAMVIERTVANTAFTYDAYASFGGRVTVTLN